MLIRHYVISRFCQVTLPHVKVFVVVVVSVSLRIAVLKLCFATSHLVSLHFAVLRNSVLRYVALRHLMFNSVMLKIQMTDSK